MNGYQLTFFTEQNRKHAGLPIGEWLLKEAKKLGVGGATLVACDEGFGRDGKLHSSHFIELADQPIEVTMALSEADADSLLQQLRQEKVNVFYVKTPIEFGMTAADTDG